MTRDEFVTLCTFTPEEITKEGYELGYGYDVYPVVKSRIAEYELNNSKEAEKASTLVKSLNTSKESSISSNTGDNKKILDFKEAIARHRAKRSLMKQEDTSELVYKPKNPYEGETIYQVRAPTTTAGVRG